ncbi:gamma-glutamylcyclotransferase family protein [Ammonifex thiophilus]|uniref:Gamma-glutamylcyclotransferase n=1 Tax=Ammonifex thiophilus TaxID=444093 RepID=A0A3D8P5I7_9THEO|nr:gamma-glutamylcyclotransferase family protein [Ammonifex thiophilus]RDV83572.1 gamma-glutamylcyclotransferase [Ammonifex thiophilus]
MEALVFAYGFFMQNRSSHGALRGSRFLGRGKVKGLGLWAVTPRLVGAVREPEGELYGEVYAVDRLTLDFLDRLQGNGKLFRRELFPVMMEDGKELQAWVYLWLHRRSTCKATGEGSI